MNPAFPSPPPETCLIIQPGAGLATLPHRNFPALSEIITRSLAHLRTSQSPATRHRKPGEECDFEIAPGVMMRMCWIPPGEFLMGSLEGELGHRSWEAQHRVPALTNRTVLARNLDFLATNAASSPILTVHQSKGLEFDTVFIAGMTEDEFPSFYAKRDLKLEVEKRLFYVAITRAKRHLILSSYRINDWGREKPPSSFLEKLICDYSSKLVAPCKIC